MSTTGSSPAATDPNTVADTGDAGSPDAELEELRLRVAAQDRLIDSFVAQNADIHELRRRNDQLERYLGRLLSMPAVQHALRLRRRISGRGDEV